MTLENVSRVSNRSYPIWKRESVPDSVYTLGWSCIKAVKNNPSGRNSGFVTSDKLDEENLR